MWDLLSQPELSCLSARGISVPCIPASEGVLATGPPGSPKLIISKGPFWRSHGVLLQSQQKFQRHPAISRGKYLVGRRRKWVLGLRLLKRSRRKLRAEEEGWRCREAPGNKELLRGRALGSTYGKRQQEHHLIIPEPPGPASSLCTNPVTFPGSLQGVPTLLFLKLTRTRLVGLSALYVQT